MKKFDYICISCGERIPIDYDLDGTFTKPMDCSKCGSSIPFNRVKEIIDTFINPPTETTLNPTQEQYVEKEIQKKAAQD